ncbi:MAG TPA: hypothetical protein VHB97_03180, partial [Polyangia bacterium]|nr:hypothetical protein [Polyangia bacterium]
THIEPPLHVDGEHDWPNFSRRACDQSSAVARRQKGAAKVARRRWRTSASATVDVIHCSLVPCDNMPHIDWRFLLVFRIDCL